MANRNREFLTREFADGQRPEGRHFADMIDSGFNKIDDGLDIGEDSTLVLSRGLGLGDSAREEGGTLRFNGTVLQFHDGSDWVSVGAGGGGIFQDLGDGNVFYADGNVGIGDFGEGTVAPGGPLDVRLQPGESVRLGSAAVRAGASQDEDHVLLSHREANLSSDNDYSVRFSPGGEVRVNAPRTQPIGVFHNGNRPRLVVTGQDDGDGVVVINGQSTIDDNSQYRLQVQGAAFKSVGGGAWNELSDLRVKEDVRDLDVGLTELRRVRPTRFRFNGKAGTQAGEEAVGVIGQEIEQIFPEMVQRVKTRKDSDIQGDDLRIYNGSALTYVLVNAVKELADRVEVLEAALARMTEPKSPASAS
jgi:hypothetical protein